MSQHSRLKKELRELKERGISTDSLEWQSTLARADATRRIHPPRTREEFDRFVARSRETLQEYLPEPTPEPPPITEPEQTEPPNV